MKKEILLNKKIILLISIVFYILLVVFFYHQTRAYAITKATEKIEEVLLNTQALRKYVSIQKDEIYRLQKEGYIYEEYFSPIILSSTFVSKGVNSIYNVLREDDDKDAITIRFAAPNPRNLDNLASSKEVELLDLFNQGKIDRYKELIQTDRGQAIYFATPTRVTTAECVTCHSDPSLAPKDLVDMYGATQGFYEHNGEIRAILSTIYPIKNDLNDANFFFYLLSLATLFVFAAIVFIAYKFLKIIDNKQLQLENANKNLEKQVHIQTKKISDQNEYLDLILNSSPNIIIVSDVEKIIYSNDSFFKVFDSYTNQEQFNNQHIFKDFIYQHFCGNDVCNLNTKIAPISKQEWLNIFIHKVQRLCFNEHSTTTYYTISTTKIKHDGENIYLHILTNITELELAKLKLEELSIKDDLTKLYNRRYFNTIYKQELKRANRDNLYLTFAIFDIDYFKNYNDTLGHIKGDLALIQIAKATKLHFNRSSDYIFRMGGEEFSIITTSTHKDSIKEHILQFHQSIESLQITHPDSKIAPYLTVSMGVFCSKVTDLDAIDFYKEADKLLYKAKQKRNSVQFNF